MIAVAILSFFVIILFYLYGMAICMIVGRIFSVDAIGEADPPLVIFLGQGFVAVIAMIMHLFIPLSELFVTGLILGSMIIAYRGRSLFSFSRPLYISLVWVILIFAFLSVLENATHSPLNPDTGLYHVQTIRWFEAYRIVPGLGNFESRYAFNSSWLVLNASLSFAFLGLRSFHLINGITFFMAFLYFLSGLKSFISNGINLSSVIKILFLPLSFYLLSSEISSLGNDMPITFLTWIILLLWMEKLEHPSSSAVKDIFIVLLSSFAVTIKLSSLPLLLFGVFVFVEYMIKNKKQYTLSLVFLSLAILLPWMARSVFLSGYLVYPQTQLDIINVDWKMPDEIVEYTMQGIVGIARFGNSWDPSTPLTFAEWIPIWFNRLTINRQAMLYGTLFSPLLLLIAWFRYPLAVSLKFLYAFGVMIMGLVFWFFTAPSIRFGYGFIIAACSLALAPFMMELFAMLNKRFSMIPGSVLLVLAGFQFYSFWYSLDISTLSQRWLLPADYPSSTTVPCDLDGITIACRPEGTLITRCFYDVFPCSTLHRNTDVRLRGTTYQDGFTTVSPSEN